jgi:hypothetical protein
VASRGIERGDLEAVAHEGFLRYRRFRWFKIALGISLLLILVYLVVDVQPRHNGGSWLGYVLGTIGLLLILWLAMLGIRKRAITRGRWSLKAWTSAHVYLGLALIIIGTLHTGFQFGWNVHTIAYVLMMLVILSGIYGITVYAALPQGLSDSRSEMTGPQMIEAVNSLDKQIQSAAQPLSDADSEVVLGSLGEQVVGLLEKKAAALQRVRGYVQRRALLEIWLYIHVPLTVVLIAALIAHVVSVFFYW